jgi:hypothetical protein
MSAVSADHGLRRRGNDICGWGQYFLNRLFPSRAFYFELVRAKKLDDLEIGMPMEGAGHAFAGIGAMIVGKARLLAVFNLNDQLHHCFRRIIGLVIRIGVIVVVIPVCLAAHAHIQKLERDNPDEDLSGQVYCLFIHRLGKKLVKYFANYYK